MRGALFRAAVCLESCVKGEGAGGSGGFCPLFGGWKCLFVKGWECIVGGMELSTGGSVYCWMKS